MVFDLKSSYPLDVTLSGRIKESIAISFFVFLFLLIFQPFGLNALYHAFFITIVGYGITCFVVLALLNVAVLFNFFNYFSEENWTLGRALFWSMLNIACISIANSIYSALIGIGNFSLHDLLKFVAYTVALGIFPAGISMLINQIRLKNKFERESGKINREFASLPNSVIEKQKGSDENTDFKPVIIYAENGKACLTIVLSELLFIHSTDNYVEVFYLEKNKASKMLIRNSLKSIDNSLVSNKEFFRCHKSYLVNMKKVIRVSGNAQGYKLHLSGTDELIPVSRTKNESVRKLLVVRP